MQAFQTYSALLASLAKTVGLEAESLEKTEEIVIDGLSISLRLQGEGHGAEVWLCSLLGSPPAERLNEVMNTLLQANHLWTGSGGATFGMLPETHAVSMSVRLLLGGLNANVLAEILGSLANTGLAWKNYLGENHAASPQPAEIKRSANLLA